VKYYSITILVLAIIITNTIAKAGDREFKLSNHTINSFETGITSSEDMSTSMVLDLGPDLTFCQGDSAILDATTPGSTYLWQDGSDNPTLTVTQSGTYWVEVNTSGNIESDTINVTVNNTSNFTFGPDFSACTGEVIVLSGFTPDADYLWHDGTTTSFYSVTQTGTYSLEVDLNGCLHSDTITITFVPGISVDLGPDQNVCLGDQVNLDASINDPTVNYLWQDGSTSPTYTVTQSGIYHVTLDNGVCPVVDTIEVTVNNTADINLGPDTVFCTGNEILLDPNLPGASFTWQDGSTGATFIADQTGWYWVTTSIGTCMNTDSIFVTEISAPIIDLGPDQFICEGDSIQLDGFYSGATYLWQDGSTNSTIWANQTGTYTVTVDFNGCTYTDSTHIELNPYPVFNLGFDTTLCEGETLTISGFTSGASYLWQDGSTNSTLDITQTGTYSLTVNLNGCESFDTIQVIFDPSPIIDLGPSQNICSGDSILLDAFFTGASYAWSTGNNSSSIYVSQSGIYSVDLNLNGCTYTDSIEIIVNNVSSFDLGSDTTLCEGETLTLSGFTPGANYLWQDGSTTSFLNATLTGQYHLTVDLNGCITSDTIQVTFDPSPIIDLGPDVSICEGDSLLLDAVFPGASYIWNTGSTSSSIYVSQSGIYQVDLDLNGCSYIDSIEVTVNNSSNFQFGNDTTLCEGETLVLSGFTPGANYLWQDGSTNSFFNATQTGLYHLTVDLNGCITQDTIQVNFDPSPIINLGPDQFICEGDSILLDAFFSGASYTWQDGSTNSSIYASQSGLYYVQLDLNDCSFIDSIQVTVGTVANFTLGSDTSICQGESITLSTSITGASYLWQDGSTNNSLTVNQTGSYSLQVNLNGCISADTIDVTVQPSPIISLGPDLQICEGDSVELNAFYPGATYTWQDGSTNSNLWVSQNGIYTVSLDLNGCTFEDQIMVSVNNYPIVNLGSDTSICELETVLLNASNPGSSYLWQDGSNNPTFQVQQSGIYTVAVNNNGCISYDTIEVIVKPLPIVDLGPDISACEGDQIILNAFYPGASYSWNTGSSNSIIYVQTEGLYTIDILLNGCDYQESIYISFFPIPEINLPDSAEICDGEVYQIDATYPENNANYLWQDGSTLATFNASQEGLHIVTVEAFGCEFTDSLFLTVHPLPEAPLSDTSICLGEEFLFDAYSQDAIAYEWQDGSTASSFLADEEGWYYVDIYNQNCQIRDSAYLTINTVPLFGLPEDTFLCEDTPILFEFDPTNASYIWQDGSTNSTYEINQLGIYTLTISNSCGTSDFTMKVHPKDCSCNIYIPNAFNPGNGGINETLVISSDCEIAGFKLKIFNRWGQIVFESNSPLIQWDGTLDGTQLPQDVYIYELTYSQKGKNKLYNSQGIITLLR